MVIKALGQRPNAERRAAFANSRQFKNGVFQNVEPTSVMREGASYVGLLRQTLNRPKLVRALHALPSVRVDLHILPDSEPQVVWFGHSSYLISHSGFRILVDPVLFGVSSPVPFIGHPFPVTVSYSEQDIPPIDLLVLSHDHYDHLDVVTLTKLKHRIKRIVCPLGVASHLVYWGFDASIINELDWHDRIQIASDVAITALPARHFSGRVFTRNTTLWASYALELRQYKIFIGGDSGYDAQFKRIGEQHGPFDIALLECGQYGKDWPNIHMLPEETATAAADLQAKQLLPVHWAKFLLANHTWSDPIERLVRASSGASYSLHTPDIGAAITVGSAPKPNAWWERALISPPRQ